MLGFILHLVKIMPISYDLIYSNIDTLALIGAGSQIMTGGVPGLFKGITGLATSAFGKKAKDLPQYTIPQEVFEVTRRAEEMAQTGMPEASRMQALQGAQQAALFRQRAAGQSRLGQANVATNETLFSRDLLNIASIDAQKRQENQLRAQQALMTQAQFRDKAFANLWQSKANELQQERARIGAIEQNAARNMDTASSMLMMSMGGGFGGLGGGRNTPPTTTPPIAPLTPPSTINSFSAIRGSQQLPSNMMNTGGSFLWNNNPSASQLPANRNIYPNYEFTPQENMSRSIFQSLITR